MPNNYVRRGGSIKVRRQQPHIRRFDQLKGGTQGNAIVYGHNNIGSAAFSNISALEIGDPVYANVDGRIFGYRVTEVHFIDAASATRDQALEFLAPTEEPIQTLMSCWPI